MPTKPKIAKAVKEAKKATAPKAETKAAKPKATTPKTAPPPKPTPFMPILGEKYEHNGNIIAVASFEPLTASVYAIENGVQTVNAYQLDSLKNVHLISKAEIYARIY